MHWVIPFAAASSSAGRAALRGWQAPNLRRLLAGRAFERDSGDELSLSPPHERALARLHGWHGGDGLLPLAAQAAQADGLDTRSGAWGLLCPVHWHLGTEQLSLLDPDALALSAADSRELYEAVAPLFTSEGFTLHWGAPLRWYAVHDSLRELPCASLDRVIGRNVDPWLPSARTARLWRRLQNEAQMLLYGHALNAAREAAGRPTVNSLWLSGCGPAQAAPAPVVLETRLRGPALAEDWAAWCKAWEQIDAEVPTRAWTSISLCGERAALHTSLAPLKTWARWTAPWRQPDLAALLEAL